MAERRVAVALVVVVAAVVVLAVPSAEAGAAPCSPAKAPTRASAWRAYVPPSTPLRSRPSGSVAHAPLTCFGAWRLVLGAARARNGTCLPEVRLDRRPNTVAR